MKSTAIVNAMTVDVEDYFQVSAFEGCVNKADWDNIPHRVEENTQRILGLFEKYNVKATFFTLGWVAERYPSLIKKIVAQGHELASHGYEHVRVTTQDPQQFREDVHKTKLLLEDIGGKEVIGYRAASYSITNENLWALQVLEDEGFLYSSSIYPVKHDLYGIPGAPRYCFQPDNLKKLKEIPISTMRLLGKNYPCGGGGFFRLYPYFVSKFAYNYLNSVEHQSGIFYFHPWEIDVDQPRQSNLSMKSKFRHYLNLQKMEGRLEKLLVDFNWDTMESVFLQK